MDFFKTGVNLFDSLKDFIDASNNLRIYVPYIKLDTLKSLINDHSSVEAIFVKWDINDILLGSSDLEIFPYLQEKGIALYRCKRLHLKAFIDDGEKCFMGSANISHRALNYPGMKNYNFEVATIHDEMSLPDKVYFKQIELTSLLITTSIFDQLNEQISQKMIRNNEEEDFSLVAREIDKEFLISSLPLSSEINKLTTIYLTGRSETKEDLECAIHDIVNYSIPLGLSKTDFITKLKTTFFNHPFINKFLNDLNKNGEIYFGAAKDWIQKNCSNVPIPGKWELTTNIQILYHWIIELSNGEYFADRPNYSERLFRKIL